VNWYHSLIFAVPNLFRRDRLNHDLEEELRFHLEMETEAKIRQGMSREEAERAARLRMGGLEQIKEECRDAGGFPWLESVLRDIQLAFRSIRKHPSFAATVLVTLTLGIGVTAAVFTVINAFWLNPLPYKNLDRLVWMENFPVQTDRSTPSFDGTGQNLAPAEFYDWKEKSEIFEEVVGFDWFGSSRIPEKENPVDVAGMMVSPKLFSVLGVEPLLGRTFVPEDGRSDGDRAVILQYDFWQSHYGGDPNILGKRIPFGPYEPTAPGVVIGVMKPGFALHQRNLALFVPFRWGENVATPGKTTRKYKSVGTIGLLKPGTSMAQAQAQADAFSESLAAEYPETNQNVRMRLVSLKEKIVREVKPAAMVLLGAVGLVLLIASTNVASLQLVRGITRAKELAVRKALGAGRWRLVRMLVTESMILSVLGGLLGLGLTWMMVQYFRTQLPYPTGWGEHLVQVEAIRVDFWVIAFVISTVFLIGALFSLFAVWRVSSPTLTETLKDVGDGSLGGRGTRKLRSGMVVAEVALAVVLVVGAVLLVRTFVALYNQGSGFRPEKLYAISFWNSMDFIYSVSNWPSSKKPSWEELGQMIRTASEAFKREVPIQVGSIPGVESVTLVDWAARPMRAPSYVLPEWVLKDDKGETNLQPLRARQARVAANYFEVLGIPLLQGRVFGPEDRKDTIPVAIVSESAARKFWPTANPLGKQLRNSDMEDWLTVVGVVGDVRDDGLDQPPVPRVYWAASQQSVPKGEVIVRTSMDMRALMPVIRERIRSVDSSCFIQGPWSLSQVVRDSIWRVNYSMLLLVGLAGLSLILALVGIYGVLSWTVRERLREIGLRMALGADRLQVLWLVVRQGLMIVLMGIALGLMIATGLTRYLQSLLFGVEPMDWITFLLVSLSVLITALVASYIPAYRATRVNPMVALRYE